MAAPRLTSAERLGRRLRAGERGIELPELRVADIQACYEQWSSKGAEFERAKKQSLAHQLRDLEQAQDDATVKLQQLTAAGFFARRRLLPELRGGKAA